MVSESHTLTLIDFNVSTDGVVNKGPTGEREWSAPETRSQPEYDSQCDMWSVGCLLYFMYSGGDNPFIMSNDIE